MANRTAAQNRATKKWEDKAYYKVLVRFRKEDEGAIREASGNSVNGFIVRAVMDAVGAHRNAQESENAQDMVWYAFPRDMVEEMQKYGDPLRMLFDGALAMLAEYRAGVRS